MVQTLPNPTAADRDRHLICSDITWQQFKLIQAGFAESKRVRLFYDNNTIEIFMPGLAHEFFKTVIGMLLELFCLENNIEYIPMGSTTQELEGEVSVEPDESYCFGTAKSTPDLAVEVIFTSGSPRKLERYRILKTPEVWLWQDGVFTLYHLYEDGYKQITSSEIPELANLDIELLTRCVLMAKTSRLEAANTFRNAKK
ncbi:Uma2 family endonuclease [Pseudanabaena sp. PCC 6802]|uniref:Uma2 family endonuclease n=1 Tax=Pseudanabaena sp. PCC 6802 TaxID=118173 RepID=UPI0003496B27|nr:Uma2 family endonuclease [Pseudanabaena sp. PCC 6802]